MILTPERMNSLNRSDLAAIADDISFIYGGYVSNRYSLNYQSINPAWEAYKLLAAIRDKMRGE